MKNKILFIFLTSLFTWNLVWSQEQLILEHQRKSSKQKTLDLNRYYDIKTIDTHYLNQRIIDFTHQSISILTWVNTGEDSSYSYTYKLTKDRDTTVIYTRPIFKEEIVVIPFQGIEMLKKDWFKDRSWLEGFAWIGIGAAMGGVLLPFAAIDSGIEGVKDWAIFEGILLGIAGPPIFIGSRKTKYNLKKKWSLKVFINE